MRKILKFLHTLAACGLIGGLLCYMILLLAIAPASAAAYADLRWSIAALSNYLLLPALALALVSGLLSMVVHRPFQDQRWALVKAALGILMFKGVLTIVGAKADGAAALSAEIAQGRATAEALDAALAYEWHALATVMALSLANVVLGVRRPRLKKVDQPRRRPARATHQERADIPARERPAA